MAYCRNCGSPIDDKALICPKCGIPQADISQSITTSQTDSGGFGWGVLGFFLPIVGLVLFLIWKDEKPRSAKFAGIGALISAGVGIVIAILYFFLFFLFLCFAITL